MAGTVPYFFGGGFWAVGTFLPTKGNAAGLAALATAYPALGNITTQGNQFYTVWNGPGDTGGFDGSSTPAGGELYQGTAPFMVMNSGTTTIHPIDITYPAIAGPGIYGTGVYWKVTTFCCAPSGCIGVNDLGACFTAGSLYMLDPPLIPGYYYDPNWAIQALPLAGFPPGTYPDPVTGHPVIPVPLNDPGQPPPPGPPINPPPPLPGNPAPPGTDGTFVSNPPGNINWRIQRCDFKPRQEEKA